MRKIVNKDFERRKKLICDLIYDDQYQPMKIKEIAILLQAPREKRDEIKMILDQLIAEEKITQNKRGKYMKTEDGTLSGVFIGNAKGFGFVEIEGQDQDIFIPEGGVNGALHKDVVQVAVQDKKTGKRKEGKVIKILSHGIHQLVATYQKSENFGFAVPDNQKITRDIFIPAERSKGAVNGHKVLVELTSYGENGKKPEGKVIEILGHRNDPGVDILSIIYEYELPMNFPERVLNQAERIPEVISAADLEGRKDLRKCQMVTIDGEDAKDLDDAVSVSFEDGIYHLGVHIADVTNYVQENSALDREALKRGTSVYLVDRVIPMLPHRLSNGICSLNQGVDRLALSCIMDIDAKGNIIGHQIAETVICVDRRMTYTSVKKILADKDESEIAEYQDFVPMFQMMEELAALLRNKRKRRGSIDFDFPETKVLLDPEGHPEAIKPYERNVATKIIEEFMLAANETIAQDFYWQELPFVYRTHDNPDPDKIQQLGLLIQNFGFFIKSKKDEIHPKEIQKLLANIEESPQEALISRLTLRSMKQAKYTVECTGHFGLAADYYCHFTSPIRRYPDLQIHRIIKDNLRGRMTEQKIEHYGQILNEVSNHSSKMERRAEEAERETVKLKKAEYMADRIGQFFDGVISGVTSWGMYVELENTVEGMVHISDLEDDYYMFDEKNYELFGEESHNRYKLGQKVRICVKEVDQVLRTVYFELADIDISDI